MHGINNGKEIIQQLYLSKFTSTPTKVLLYRVFSPSLSTDFPLTDSFLLEVLFSLTIESFLLLVTEFFLLGRDAFLLAAELLLLPA